MTSRCRAPRCAPILPLALLAAPPPAFAQATTDGANDAILVVGQRDAPIAIEPRGLSVSLGDAQFGAVNAFDTQDLIKYAPDFFVRSRYIGDNNAVPGFRGTHSTQSARSLVMVDGFVISDFLGNSYSYPPAWGVIGPEEVRQVDIVYGPYSARYPGNSMGGIVAITTRPPDHTGAFARFQNFHQSYDQFATHESLWGASAEGGFSWKPDHSPWGARVSARRLVNRAQPMQFYLLGYSAAVYDDPGVGTPVTGAVIDPGLMPAGSSGIVTPVIGDYSATELRQDQVRGEVRYDRGDMHGELLFASWWNTEKTLAPRTYLRDADGAPFHGDATGIVSFAGHGYTLDPATSFRLGLSRKDEWLAGARIEAPVAGFTVRLNLSTLRFAKRETAQSNGYADGISDGPGQFTRLGPTGWVTGTLLATRDSGVHHLAFGLDGNLYQTDQSVFATHHWREGNGAALTSRTFGRTRTIGAFAEDAIALSPATRLTLGLRYDSWRAFDGGLTALVSGAAVTQHYASRTDAAWSPKVALRDQFGDGWTAELSLATATRFPTVGELFQGALGSDGRFDADSFDPDLAAERSHDANLIVRRAFGSMTLTGSLFYQRVRNALFDYVGVNADGTTSSRFRNIDVTRQIGAELIAEAHDWPVRGMDVDANAAWIDAITVRNAADPASEGMQFPRIPHWRLNGTLRYRFTPRLQGTVGARYASRPNSDLDGLYRGDDYGYTSELFALDLRATYAVTPQLRLSAGVNNVTDFRAFVFHPYPQRTVVIEAGVKL